MNKYKKNTALIISFVMVFSLVLSPFSAAYASEPNINLPTIKPPIVTAPAAVSKVNLEAPTRLQGVNYEFKNNIKKLPKTMNYEFKPLTLDKFASFELDAKAPQHSPATSPSTGINMPQISIPGGASAQPAAPTVDGNDLCMDKISGIRYPAGSKIMNVSQNLASSFVPDKNDIYIDEEEGTAFRVLDTTEQDKDGNAQYIIDTPQLTDIFESYTIPEQTINLTTGNIAYIAPEFELSPESGMPKNYVADSGTTVYENEYIKCSIDGNKHILTLKEEVLLFEYPSKEEKEADEKAKKEAEKQKFKGDWWKEDQYDDLRGFENESSLTVAIKVKQGKITVEDPKFHAKFDLNKLTTHVEADFYFDAKTTADITLDGDLTFNKTLEKCVYGYDIDLGKVMGIEKGNKAFVGIFIVLGVNGKIHVEVRVQTTGNSQAGFAYRAFGYGLLPYYAGPYATYRPSTFDMSFTVNGEINATLACVPQVGVIIWGCELGQLQVWVGFKANAKFSASGGGGTSGNQGFEASGSIKLDAFGELVGYLLGSRYSIFYIDFPLYSGEWKVGEKAEGSGGDAVREIPPYVTATSNAATNVVEGKIAFDTQGNQSKPETGYSGESATINSTLRPYANGHFAIEVYDKSSNLKYRKNMTTDAEGKFTAQFGGYENIIPTDKVFIDVPRITETITVAGNSILIDKTPIIKIDNKKFKVIGKSAKIATTVPFDKLDFNADAFNNVITGWVSGNYTGPVEIEIFGDPYGIYIAQALNGIFKFDYPIDEKVLGVKAGISFEGSKFPYDYNSLYSKKPNLAALTINLFNEFKLNANTDETKKTKGFGITIPKGIDKAIQLPITILDAQDKLSLLTGQDSAGNKFIKPSRVIGTVSNKGDMGWLISQGDNYVRPGTNTNQLKYYDGNIKITEIEVQSALEAMLEEMKGPHDNWLPKPQSAPPWTATVQGQRAMRLKPIKDSSQPMGIRIEQIPTSAAQFEFTKPDVVAYVIEIEHEGLKLTKTYNPFVSHYNNNQQSIDDFIGPLQKAATLVTDEKIDSVVNPADVMNQWQGTWATQMGKMELSQKGTAITGTIMQGATSYIVEGTVSNGVFKGSYIVPSASGFGFGDIVTFEMDISTDGKSINFKNLGTGTSLKSLNGTKAIKQ